MIPAHNLLSALRIVATPAVALLGYWEETRAAAIAVAILVGVTDFIDGPLARRSGVATPLGALLDMTADKVFLCTMLIVLAVMGLSPVWAAAVIGSRELLVLFLRVVAAQRGRDLPIATFGKLKTFMLYLLVPMALFGVAWQAIWFLAAAASVSALGSLVEYIVKMRTDLAAEFLTKAPGEASEESVIRNP